MDDGDNVCIRCGACCACFRVSFYWSEAVERGLPESLTEQVNSFRSCMAGTNSLPVRCAALEGEIGSSVRCTVYDQRPSPCRSVMPDDEKCLRARERLGLGPL
jgi:Fe-S-cluster containining protein